MEYPYTREHGYRTESVALEAAFITTDVREALHRSHTLRMRVREHLRDSLESYYCVDVGRDNAFRVVTRLSWMLCVLQRATGLPLLWHERQFVSCHPPGVVDAGVTRPALGRFYFRVAVPGQGAACDCARTGRSSGRRRSRCFCAWLRDSFRLCEGIGPSNELGLSCAQYFQYWSARQVSTLYAWVSLRTLCLLAHLVDERKVVKIFEKGAWTMAKRVAAVMETNEEHVVIGKDRKRKA